jgi:hypothetical protein
MSRLSSTDLMNRLPAARRQERGLLRFHPFSGLWRKCNDVICAVINRLEML